MATTTITVAPLAHETKTSLKPTKTGKEKRKKTGSPVLFPDIDELRRRRLARLESSTECATAAPEDHSGDSSSSVSDDEFESNEKERSYASSEEWTSSSSSMSTDVDYSPNLQCSESEVSESSYDNHDGFVVDDSHVSIASTSDEQEEATPPPRNRKRPLVEDHEETEQSAPGTSTEEEREEARHERKKEKKRVKKYRKTVNLEPWF